MKNIDAIENIAVSHLSLYLSNCHKLKPIIYTNDRYPIWDGELFVYNSVIHSVKSYSAQIPLQVKGTTNTKDDFYRIKREYLINYRKERGTLFFLVQIVQEDEFYKPIKILYNMLSSDALGTLLEQDTKTIKLVLKEIPENRYDFEKEIIEFARKRNGEKLENLATNEMESLTKKFKEAEKHINMIEDDSVRHDLELLFNNIKTLKCDGTIGWRDKFINYSQKTIDLTVNNIGVVDSNNLLLEFGDFLYQQKQ